MVAASVRGKKLKSNVTREGSRKMYRLVSSVASEDMGFGKKNDELTVLGGKASCRRKFVLNLHLVDDSGNSVSRDMVIIASIAYAHDHSPVVRDEKSFLAEPPLFTTFNGVEFPAQDRPTRMVSGRASFKLAISLLSSKCDNRLFCVCFTPQMPFSEVSPVCVPCYSKPIRSISRKRPQPAPVSSGPSLLLLTGLEAKVTASIKYNNKRNESGASESSGSEDFPFGFTKKSTGDEPDGMTSPVRLKVRSRSRSSSITTMPIRSISRKRPQPAPVSSGPSLLLLTGLEAKVTPSIKHNNKLELSGASESSGSEDFPFGFTEKSTGDDPDGMISPVRLKVRSSSRSGSITTMHYCSPSSGSIMTDDFSGFQSHLKSNKIGESVLNIQESLSKHTNAGSLGNFSAETSDRFDDTDPSGSSSGNMVSRSRSPASSTPVSNAHDLHTQAVPCSLSLRLSPSDSGSPTSGGLAWESTLYNKYPASTLSELRKLGQLSAPSVRTCRNIGVPLRPYASVGACSVPRGNFPFGTQSVTFADTTLDSSYSIGTPIASPGDKGTNTPESTRDLLERVQELRANTLGNINNKADQIHHFSVGSGTGDQKFMYPTPERILEAEETSLHCLEIRLQEVSRDVQRRKEELRFKRRRLLEDKAHMLFQSSSWIESLRDKFSLKRS